MTVVIGNALALWDMPDARYQLVAARENHVYRVDHGATSFALRVHRPNYRNTAELQSELAWMAAAAQGGLPVPAPLPSASGALLHLVDGMHVDLLTWMPGAPLGANNTRLHHPNRIGLFTSLGRQMARLHEISDAWQLPEGFSRCSWDRAGLLGETPLWGRFWENPALSAEDRVLFEKFRKKAHDHLASIEGQLDYGLIHADLVRENVMIDGDTIGFIDFDDGGFGFRLFDLATTLLPNLIEPDFDALKSALIVGYLGHRPLDTRALDLFVVLRSTTFVGWIVQRMNEPEFTERNNRFVSRALSLTESYLSNTV